MQEGTVVEWLVPDGSAVTLGQPLYVLESEKSTQDIECPATGTLKIGATPGQACKVGDVVGEIS